MNSATLSALSSFPDALERVLGEVPETSLRWVPTSWDGIPSEQFTVLEQVCHVRDIEIDGYRVRIRRMVEETNPVLADIESYELAAERHYADADPREALATFRAARLETVKTIASLSEAQLARTGSFGSYGSLTLKGLIHFLCSHDQQHLAGLQWLLGKMSAPAT